MGSASRRLRFAASAAPATASTTHDQSSRRPESHRPRSSSTAAVTRRSSRVPVARSSRLGSRACGTRQPAVVGSPQPVAEQAGALRRPGGWLGQDELEQLDRPPWGDGAAVVGCRVRWLGVVEPSPGAQGRAAQRGGVEQRLLARRALRAAPEHRPARSRAGAGRVDGPCRATRRCRRRATRCRGRSQAHDLVGEHDRERPKPRLLELTEDPCRATAGQGEQRPHVGVVGE